MAGSASRTTFHNTTQTLLEEITLKPHTGVGGHVAHDEFYIVTKRGSFDKWKKDPSIALNDILELDSVFIKRSGVSEHERASHSDLERQFKTNDSMEVAKIILQHGEPRRMTI